MPTIAKANRKKLQAMIDAEYGYRDYQDDHVEVRMSKKAGRGVFAMRQFEPGEFVMEITGQLLRQKDYEGSTYVMELDSTWYVEPGIPGAFINHSCSPNCELIQVSDFSLGLVAICNIEEGSELSFDYQWEAYDWTPKCLCGSRNCRGWVVAASDLKKMKKLAKASKKPK
ncbi:MAG: SET domain-containing protein [Planctomycetota bacterium]